MCSSPVIQVENLSKLFRMYNNPRDRLKQIMLPGTDVYHRDFWALKNVSFNVGQGQTVGIIGQNGSGKSTLLQIITGTMSPTEGSVKTTGKIAALLELGSGFNPEFTGRENVYLNGSLLGLSHEEMDDKFDFIAGFADIGDYLDQAVKTYSSGMMLRLAFAVQVAVETEVLIIDEALAVGDARFQLKCFKRLEELKSRGTTILFVSHATETVRSFCDFGLVLEKGVPLFWGDARTATVKYLASLYPDEAEQPDPMAAKAQVSTVIDYENNRLVITPNADSDAVFGKGGADLAWIRIEGLELPNIVRGGDELRIQCQFSWDIAFVQTLIEAENYEPAIGIGIALSDKKGSFVFGCNAYDAAMVIDAARDGVAAVELKLTMPHLTPGDYFFTVDITIGNAMHHIQLKWYDSVLQVECTKSDRNVFGIFAVDYQLTRLPLDIADGAST